MPVLLAASVGVPYMVNNPPAWIDNGSQPTPQATATEKPAPEASLQNLSTPPQASVFHSSTPLAGDQTLSLEQILDLNVTKEWVYAHWPRKTTGLPELGWYGVRVPVVTGTRLDDVAGSLTYYFGPNNRVERISLRGRTADATRLVAIATRRFGLTLQPTALASQQLYQLKNGDTVVSELRTHPAGVLWDSLPHESIAFQMHIQRPETARPLPIPVTAAAPPEKPAEAIAEAENDNAQGEEKPEKARHAWLFPRSQVPKEQVPGLDKLHRNR